MGSLPRLVADDLRSLAVRQAPAAGERVSLQWRSGAGAIEASATLEREEAAIFVRYCWLDGEEWRTTRQTVGLKFDVPHFGGLRHFWRCPGCGLGARKLFDVGGGEFRCRRCGRLAHRSQREKTWQRALRRSTKIRAYLTTNSAPADPFPPRPKRMRKRTYEALKAEAERLKHLPAEAWLALGAVNIRLGVRRGTMGASRRRWWPGRNEASRSGCQPGQRR